VLAIGERNPQTVKVIIVFVVVLLLQLRYWARSEKEESASVQRTVGNQTSRVLRGMRSSTLYYITVRAYNTAGTGPPGAMVNVTTKKPRKPDCVSASVRHTVTPHGAPSGHNHQHKVSDRGDREDKEENTGLFLFWTGTNNVYKWVTLFGFRYQTRSIFEMDI